MRVRVAEVTRGFSVWMWLCDACARAEASIEGTELRFGRAIKQPCGRCKTVGDSEEPYAPPERRPKSQPTPPTVVPRPAARTYRARPAGADPTMKRFAELRASGLTREQAFEAIEAESKGN